MTSWRDVLRRSNADMLFAEDLGGYGCKPVDVEIIDSGVAKVKSKKGPVEMPWIQFRGKNGPSKKLGLNRGMSKVMTTLAGTDQIEDWRGWVTLVVVKTTYTDEDTKERLETDAIRISTKRPPPRQPAAAKPPATETAPADTKPAESKPVDTAEMTEADRRAIEQAEAEEARNG